MTNSETAEKSIKALNDRDYDAFFALATEDHERINPDGTVSRGRAPQQAVLEDQHRGAPDAHYELIHLVDGGDSVAMVVKFSGTQTGTWNLPSGQVIPPSGKHFEVVGVNILHLQGGKVHRSRLVTDRMGLMQQLGAMPQPAGVA
jgi:predicted ester cyclase